MLDALQYIGCFFRQFYTTIINVFNLKLKDVLCRAVLMLFKNILA